MAFRMQMKALLTITLVLLVFSYCCLSTDEVNSSPGDDSFEVHRLLKNGDEKLSRQTSVLLFGALGDLAKKYLWRGLFNLYVNSYKAGDTIRIYGAARTDAVKGGATLAQILEQDTFCDKNDIECNNNVSSFKKLASYHRAKSEDDYKKLSDIVQQDLAVKGIREKLRIIYLSVPPFAYPSVLSLVHKNLWPQDKETQLRVVFEKPFGHDKKSSQELHNLIMQYFKENNIYRVDHYLGKTTVDEIMKFRLLNKDKLVYLWNNDYIDSVEVVMKEKVDCKGRTEFYDEYGVLLDVMQNHLTEMFARLVMDLPQSLTHSDFTRLKLQALQNTPSPTINDILIGQYKDYNKHLAEEAILKAVIKDKKTSIMPTFAAVRLIHNSEGFKKIPFYFISGKKLNEKTGYVRINFKSFYQYGFGSTENADNGKEYYIKFFIQSPKHNGPAIEVSQSLRDYNFTFSDGWMEYDENQMRVLKPANDVDAYSWLIQKINDGDRTYFVDIDALLEAWRIWDPVQSLIKAGEISLRLYDEKELHTLDFYHNKIDNNLKFKDGNSEGVISSNHLFSPENFFDFSAIHEKTFLGRELVSGDLQSIIKKLATILIDGINDAWNKGVAYHMAFPGGKSVLPLFKHLCLMKNLFKKNHLHLWMVDERCVAFNSSKSNFKSLLDNLQECLNIPYQNLHPMLAGKSVGICKQEDAVKYAEEIKSWIPQMQFDSIVLGVGEDGHVASLFPGDVESSQSNEFVVLNQSGPKHNIQSRISITFRLINSSKWITALATGEKKRNIISKLMKGVENEKSELPILKVNPSNGTLTWFIDDSALN